eukprot:4482039-Pleurochrysis_carterae.AAC.2
MSVAHPCGLTQSAARCEMASKSVPQPTLKGEALATSKFTLRGMHESTRVVYVWERRVNVRCARRACLRVRNVPPEACGDVQEVEVDVGELDTHPHEQSRPNVPLAKQRADTAAVLRQPPHAYERECAQPHEEGRQRQRVERHRTEATDRAAGETQRARFLLRRSEDGRGRESLGEVSKVTLTKARLAQLDAQTHALAAVPHAVLGLPLRATRFPYDLPAHVAATPISQPDKQS